MGYFGSNPLDLGKYLKHKGIRYKKCYRYKNFSNAVSEKKKCVMVMSQWNRLPDKGIHTYAIKKNSANDFAGFNYKYDTKPNPRKRLVNFADGGFIVGYLVW